MTVVNQRVCVVRINRYNKMKIKKFHADGENVEHDDVELESIAINLRQ